MAGLDDFDIGQAAKLSRYTLVGRTGDSGPGEFMWGYGTPQTWLLGPGGSAGG